MTRHLIRAVALAALAAVPAGAQAGGNTYAITDATIIPVVGAPIDRGTVVIQNGRIAAVGASVPVPAGAERIDGRGLFVYPGLIDAGSHLGLTEIGSVPGGIDLNEIGDFNPHNLALTAVNPHSELIPTVRVNGITSVVTSASGGQIQGYAALIDLAGWTPDEMAVRPMAAMVMTYPRTFRGRFRRSRQEEGDSAERLNRQVRALRDYLQNALAYSKIEKPAKTDLAFEAMRPVFGGSVPTIFDAETPEQIRGVFALADEFELRVILRGASGAWELADSIAARKIPVIVGPTTRAPDGDDPYDAIYGNPGVLSRAGITIAFQTDDAADSRNLPYNAALATAYGLDPDEALRAITINPARIFGVADQLGSIEVGKVANLQLTTGDPLDVRTVVKQVFVRGVPADMMDRHTKLFEKFRARPSNR